MSRSDSKVVAVLCPGIMAPFSHLLPKAAPGALGLVNSDYEI